MFNTWRVKEVPRTGQSQSLDNLTAGLQECVLHSPGSPDSDLHQPSVNIFTRNQFFHMHRKIAEASVLLSVSEPRYLVCKLHELRYETSQTLFSHKVEEGQQELMARLVRQEKRAHPLFLCP